MKKKICIVLFLLLGIVIAQPKIPVITKYANDFSNTLSINELNYFNKLLYNFEQRTSNQVVFVIIESLEGYPIEEYTLQLSEKNKIGQKGRDNGVLLLISTSDKKMRIEVGYGLEGVLPDALASSIIRNEIAPSFRRGNFRQGVSKGLNAIMAATKGEYRGTTNKRTKRKEKKSFPFIYIIIGIIVLLTRMRGGFGTAFILGSMLGGSSRGSGFGGGSFGGFSGGGGGFGGGGASGGW